MTQLPDFEPHARLYARLFPLAKSLSPCVASSFALLFTLLHHATYMRLVSFRPYCSSFTCLDSIGVLDLLGVGSLWRHQKNVDLLKSA
jgi:hypothetical protein